MGRAFGERPDDVGSMTTMAQNISHRRRVELVLVPMVAALCMAFVIGAIVLDRDGANCPAAGWDNAVDVTAAGHPDAVAAMTACTGTGCLPPAPSFSRTATNGSGKLMRSGDNSWTLKTGKDIPGTVTFRAFDAAGNLLTQQTASLYWTRVGGSESCGGPMSTNAVQIRIF
jgi:hypothetical protein